MTASTNSSEMEVKSQLNELEDKHGPTIEHLNALQKQFDDLYELGMHTFKTMTSPNLTQPLHFRQAILEGTLKRCCETFAFYRETVAAQKLAKIDDCSREALEAKVRAALDAPQSSTEVMPNSGVKVESSSPRDSKATQTASEAAAENQSKAGESLPGGNGEQPVEKSPQNPAENTDNQEDIAYVNLDAAELMWKAASLKVDISKGATNTNEAAK